MLKKNHFKLIILIVIITFNIILFYQRKASSTSLKNFEREFQRITTENNEMVDFILSNVDSKYFHLDYIDSLNKFSSNQKYLFIYRYYENSCGTCIEEEFINMKKNLNFIGINNIAIITYSKNVRELKALLAARGMKDFKILNMPDSEFNFSLCKSQRKPYYSILDSNGNISMIFEPDTRMTRLTEKYYEKIIKNYFHK